MSDHLLFLMDQYAARFPTDRQYARNHMWALQREEGLYRFGFTDYAVRLLMDVYFLDWHVEPGADLAAQQEIGEIESKKAESSLYAPLAGRLTQINDRLLQDPSTINLDNYGTGWLIEIQGTGSELLSPQAYLGHLQTVWEVTRRTIHGQLDP